MILWKWRALLSRDKDANRLWWLIERAPLQDPHREALLSFCGRLVWTPEERAVIRTLFRIYRPVDATHG